MPYIQEIYLEGFDPTDPLTENAIFQIAIVGEHDLEKFKLYMEEFCPTVELSSVDYVSELELGEYDWAWPSENLNILNIVANFKVNTVWVLDELPPPNKTVLVRPHRAFNVEPIRARWDTPAHPDNWFSMENQGIVFRSLRAEWTFMPGIDYES